MKKFLQTILVLNICAINLNAQTTITLKPANGTGKDAPIANQASTTNYGTHVDLEAATWTCQGNLCLGRGLMEFDLTVIPSNAVINSATLKLFANVTAPNGIPGQPTYGNDNAGYVRRITQSWDEMTVTWDNQPATTTQNQVVIPQSTSTAQDYTLDVTALTQDIISNPTSGYGFMISEQNETTWYNSLMFCSSDHADPALAPELVVTYTAPEIVCFEVQPDGATGKDALIATQASSTNYGTHVDIEAATWSCQGNLCLGRGLVEFDLSSIPSTATIDTAFLYLYANLNAPNGISGQPTYGNDNSGYVRRITQSWDEMTVTWDNQPQTTLQDEVMIPQSVTTADNYKLDLKNMIQTYIQNPTTSHGFMIMEQQEDTWYNSLMFGSSDVSDPTIRPKLKICYTPLTAVNENQFSSLLIYPNPFNGSIKISDSNNAIKSIEVYNAVGEMVYQNHTVHGEVTIDTQSFSCGIYFSKIYTDKGVAVKKLIKN